MNLDDKRCMAMLGLRPLCEDEDQRDVVLNVLECIANSYDNGAKLIHKANDEEDSSPESFLVQELRHFYSELSTKKKC